MSKLNWEKDPLAQIVRHQKKKQTEKNHLKNKAARLRKLEKQLQAPYQSGIQVGEQREQKRIIKLLEDDCECYFDINEYYAGCHNHQLIALIKGEQK